MSLQVPMIRIRIRAILLSGTTREGFAFLHAVSDDRSGPETLGRRLRRESFLPCELDGETLLLNLAHVAYLEHPGKLPEVESHDEVAGLRIPAQLDLVHGETLVGDLISSLPPDQGRALDLLNTLDQRFVLLADAETSRYVHHRAIIQVRNP